MLKHVYKSHREQNRQGLMENKDTCRILKDVTVRYLSGMNGLEVNSFEGKGDINLHKPK